MIKLYDYCVRVFFKGLCLAVCPVCVRLGYCIDILLTDIRIFAYRCVLYIVMLCHCVLKHIVYTHRQMKWQYDYHFQQKRFSSRVGWVGTAAVYACIMYVIMVERIRMDRQISRKLSCALLSACIDYCNWHFHSLEWALYLLHRCFLLERAPTPTLFGYLLTFRNYDEWVWAKHNR